MADQEEQVPPIDDEEPEETPGYKAPAQKTLDEIQNLDADDESLVRYKQMLLAGASSVGEREIENDQHISSICQPNIFTYLRATMNVFLFQVPMTEVQMSWLKKCQWSLTVDPILT